MARRNISTSLRHDMGVLDEINFFSNFALKYLKHYSVLEGMQCISVITAVSSTERDRLVSFDIVGLRYSFREPMPLN